MNTCVLNVGRLLEVDVADGYNTPADVDAMIAAIGVARKGIAAGQKAIIAADWRRCRLLAPSAQERTLAMMTGVNSVVERSAVLVDEAAPIAVLQFLRLIRASQNEHRRLFTDFTELAAWLGEVLTPAEQQRLKAFYTRA